MNKRLIGIGVALLILASGAGLVVMHNSAQAQPIPQGTYFKNVKKLSSGKKPACLRNDTAAKAAVDAAQPQNYSYSLDLALGTPIPDMPAGTYDSTVHSFTNNQATGTITFNDKSQQALVGNLKYFDYTAQVNPTSHHWQLVRLIACKHQ